MSDSDRNKPFKWILFGIVILLFLAGYIYLGSGEPDPAKLDSTPLSVTPEPR